MHMSDARAAKQIPSYVVKEIREWDQQAPSGGAWVRWLWYAQPLRRLYHNYPFTAANALRELKDYCPSKALAAEIEQLQAEFERLAEQHRWVCAACSPPLPQRWPLRVGEFVSRFEVAPSRNPFLHPVEDRVRHLTFRAHELLLQAIGERSKPSHKDSNADVAGRKRGTVNQRMLEELQRNPESTSWTQRQWADRLDCSASAVAAAKAWQTVKAARDFAKADRLERQRQRAAN
jgi:hypothetical protein